MFKFLTVFTCLLALSQALYPYAEKDHIINVGDPTWGTAINEFPAGLIVYFYEPLCYPCRQFFPELHKTAQDLVAANSAAKIAKVECHDEIKLCDKRNVNTFPTVLLHKGERSFEYRGPRVAEAFTAWVRKVVDFKYPVMDNEADLFKRSTVVVLVEGEAVNNVNQATLNLLDLAVEVYIAGPSLKSKLNGNQAVIVTQTGKSESINGQDDAEAIRVKINGILNEQRTSVPDITWPVYWNLKDDKTQDYAFFLRTKSFKSDSLAVQAFDKAAPEFAGKNIHFLYVNVVDDMLGDFVAMNFGVTADDESTVGLISKTGKQLKKYKLTDAVSYDGIKKLIEDKEAGSAKRFYMSAEVPDGQLGYVKELTSKTYNGVTSDSKKSALVMFYYPWCEPCVKLEPTWKSLAYRLRNNENVVVGRVDITQNDVEGQDVTECPKILFYPEGDSKKVVEYSSGLNVNSLKNFLFEQVPSLKADLDL